MTLPGKPLPIRDLEAVTWGLRPRVGEAGSPVGGAGDATAVLPTCVEANAGIRRPTALPGGSEGASELRLYIVRACCGAVDRRWLLSSDVPHR